MTREELIRQLQAADLDWGDEEDAVVLVDLMLEVYTEWETYTFLFFHCSWLGATPLFALEQGRARDVFSVARSMVADVKAKVSA